MLDFCLWVSVWFVLATVCLPVPDTEVIRSPGFPHGYGPDEYKSWRLCATPGHILTIKLLHLDLEDSYECENDNLKISEGQNLLANLCGKKTQEELKSLNPALRSSTGECLNVTFRSDYSNTKRNSGFFLFYTIEDVDECLENDVACSHFCHNFIGGYSCSCKPGYYLDQDQHDCHANCTEQHYGYGVVTSPGSPGPYFGNAQCSYHLTVDAGYQLELKFTGAFDLESREGICIDFVKIKTDHQTFGPFCGKDKPAAILTASQHAEVIFHSDMEGTNQGFILEFKPTVMQCPGIKTVNAAPFPQKHWYGVDETVEVHCDVGYVVNLDSDMYESRCELDGSWSLVLHCDPVDCGVPALSFMMHLMPALPVTTYKHNMTVNCISKYYQLEGAANFTCEAMGEWVSETGEVFSKESSHCTPVCGITKEIAGGRILGGKRAELGQIPWQLLMKTPVRGGASLINDYWAITAAHVVENQVSAVFTGGMIDAQNESIKMTTKKIIIHPNFNKENLDNDIALVKMTSRVPLSSNLLPVCLPKTKSPESAMANMIGTVSGFGESEQIRKTRFLNYVQVQVYTGVCFETTVKVTENMFCAGDTNADSCEGDSGGPLFAPALGFGSAEKPYQLKGIVSWGPKCLKKQFKGYYTKVDNYLAWIKDTIKNN